MSEAQKCLISATMKGHKRGSYTQNKLITRSTMSKSISFNSVDTPPSFSACSNYNLKEQINQVISQTNKIISQTIDLSSLNPKYLVDAYCNAV